MEIQITVNGSRCKQYSFQGKTFIQANPGSEYVIEVKNNHGKRTLAVGSVDGLNVLTGKTADEKDTGYIIGAYTSEKIKGFRFSDDEWALFKFGYKFNGNTYAQSKEDGSEKNCGVIGIKFFYEKEPIVLTSTNWPWYSAFSTSASYCLNSGAISPSQIYNYSTGAGGTSYTSNVNYQSNNLGESNLYGSNSDSMNKGGKISSSRRSGGQSAFLGARENTRGMTSDYSSTIVDSCESFDVGTEWGRKERSKVKNVTFERGCLAKSIDIYYASRESLIAMGVPIENTLTVNLPQSFPNNYATPPKNWVG